MDSSEGPMTAGMHKSEERGHTSQEVENLSVAQVQRPHCPKEVLLLQQGASCVLPVVVVCARVCWACIVPKRNMSSTHKPRDMY